LSEFWKKLRKYLAPFLLIAYLLGVIVFTRTVTLKIPFSTFLDALFVCSSIIPFSLFLKTNFSEKRGLSRKEIILLSIILFFSSYWFFRNLYVIGSPLPSIPAGDCAWADGIINKTKDWVSPPNYINLIIMILDSLFLISLFIPLVTGLKVVSREDDRFSVSLRIWLYIGLATLIGVLKLGNWRYISYFFLPMPVIISKGLFSTAKRHIHGGPLKNLFFISIIFLFTFNPIQRFLMSQPVILFSVSTLCFLLLQKATQIIKKSASTITIDKKTKRRIMVCILITILTSATSLTILHFSQEFKTSSWKTELYEKVSLYARKDGAQISGIGGVGIYYMTGVNSLKANSRWGLAELRPFIEAKDLNAGLQFLINDLKVRSLIIPFETARTPTGSTSYWRTRYTYLLGILPELRIFHNPNLFETVYYKKGNFYILNLINDSWKPYGVLDVIVVGDDPSKEASLFLPCDYGKSDNMFVTYSENGVKLVIFLYFPFVVKDASSVSYNVTTKLTIIEHFKDQDEKRFKAITSSSSINLSKIVQIEACSLKGNINTEHTEISIDEIEIHMNTDAFKAYFHLIPKNETWLGYHPKGFYGWDAYVWSHRGSNLIEVNASLQMAG